MKFPTRYEIERGAWVAAFYLMIAALFVRIAIFSMSEVRQ